MPSTDKKQGSTDDRLRSTIRSRLRELGISAREASRRAGFNVGYIGDVLDGRSKAPEANRILRLAETLDFDAADFIADSLVSERETPPSSRLGPYSDLGSPQPGLPTVPLFASPLPIAAAFVAYSEKPIGYIAGTLRMEERGGYALTVPNNLNAPRFFAGETIYAKPGPTPKPGDFVVIKRKDDGKLAIARLESLTAESLKCKLIGLDGSESCCETPLDQVEYVHLIIAAAY